jgi:hypothetical protein
MNVILLGEPLAEWSLQCAEIGDSELEDLRRLLGLMLTTESPFQTPGYPYTYTCFSILSLFCKVGDAELLAGTFSRRSMPGPGKCWPESDKRRVPWWWGVLAGLVPHIGGAKPLSTSESSNYFLITYQITNC